MANKSIKPVDVNNRSNTRRTADLLPGYLRTDKNEKFLANTLDQYIQQPQLERLNGFVGSKLSLNYDPESDTYINTGGKLRTDYQFEPSMVIRNNNDDIKKVSGYDDLINQLNFYGANVSNLDRLFRPESYSYDPCIDWDKCINYRQYYWMPNGPDSIEILGQQKNSVSTYTVTDSADKLHLIFNPDGLTLTPLLTLYRGMTYVFNVDSEYPFYIKTAYVKGVQNLYPAASNQGTKSGQVILTVDDTTPNVLFYFAEGNDTAIGQFAIKQLSENTIIDIEQEVIGKQTYQSGNGVTFSNGMKVRFVGNVTPESYLDKDFIIEGVGSSIKLIAFDDLKTVGLSSTNIDVDFDATPFDEYPFDDFSFVPLTPEYITINRAAPDLNSWSRYNRWVHEDVISATAEANNVPAVFDASMRAQRPIIEFIAGMQLFNFGSTAKKNVDLIDTVTKSAFSTFEGSAGFYIDGVQVEEGFRVIFNADTDPLVRGRIYSVTFSTINNRPVVNLEETADSEPVLNNSVVAIRGTSTAGTNWWYNGSEWVFGQQKTDLNQAPLFDLYDKDGNRFADQNFYNSSFNGTKIFGYSVGTGTPDPVLGFPLKYRNVVNVGDYLFENFFMTDNFTNFTNGNLSTITVSGNYLKFNSDNGETFRDVWTSQKEQKIPIIQFQVIESATSSVQITSIENPGYDQSMTLGVFVNDVEQILNIDYVIARRGSQAYVVSTTNFSKDSRLLIKVYSVKTPINDGYYEVPTNLSNNPLNGPIGEFTFAELSDHVKTITENSPTFNGVFPGISNLRDLGDVNSYGTRLVSHGNPAGFAHYFIGTDENNLISAIRRVSDDYNQFKSSLIRQVADLKAFQDPTIMLDKALMLLSANKDKTFPYHYSDMIPYGENYTVRNYTVTDSRNKRYSLVSVFDSEVLSERAILVYLNGNLLVKDTDYVIEQFSPSILINAPLVKGDVVTVKDYQSTVGNYVPPTPTKLGLYPKFVPQIYVDNTFVSSPRQVIQGHDGSLTVAYGDFRDNVILEFEKRIYNNIKANYRSDLLNVTEFLPGAFRNSQFSRNETNGILSPLFLKWTGSFGVDFKSNDTFDELNSFTFNYSSSIDSIHKNSLPGNWRGIYKYFYDTDRPHTHPWEMLGFTNKPEWWDLEYGLAPYTSGNLILWNDLEEGRILQGDRAGVDPLYSRPGLNSIIPVDDSGNLLSPSDTGLATTPVINPSDPNRIILLRSDQIAEDWKFGDGAPAENAWRRSSYWPFAVQTLMALSNPASYSAKMFDTSRMILNKTNQYRYGELNEFISPSKVALFGDIVNGNRILASGYSVFVIELGTTRDKNYLEKIKADLSNLNYNLSFKLGGFGSKDKLQISIDAVDPDSPYPGVLVPSEDYNIIFNQSSPIESIGISGLIIQKVASGYSVRGYDKYQPYFTILKPYASNADQTLRVGGRTSSYVRWRAETTYNVGQIVFYNDRYYQVKQKHLTDATFNASYYQSLPYLPTLGGVGVQRRTKFDTEDTIVPYGIVYSNIQEVYDLIVGYGKWLISKGFVFDEFNNDLGQVLDWDFASKEFLYWTTQNWAINSVITISPFANKIKYYSTQGVVDSIINNFYEYSLLTADGSPFSRTAFDIVRLDGEFTISTVNTKEGLFFARINIVQKEHAVIFNNFTLFNDIVYDIDTGYRQRRVSLKGFRTADWNGDFYSPGFVFDQANISDWKKYTDYKIGEVVRFSGKYYSAPKGLAGTNEFNFNDWVLLDERPESQLLPNFEYKIGQFEDFYSLDIDNFDTGQQAMAQHLTGYTPRPYLNNIIGDPIAQYKFYQGYIREKGTRNPLTKISKSSLNTYQASIDFNEEWAFRVGYFGGYNTYQELETSLDSTKFIENPQIIEFVAEKPVGNTDTIYYKDERDIIISPEDLDINQIFPVIETSDVEDIFQLPVAGYVRFNDVNGTAYNKNSILDIANNSALIEGSTIWLGFKENSDWDVLRYTKVPAIITNVEIYEVAQNILLTTSASHQLVPGDLISVSQISNDIDQCYIVSEIISPTQFTVFSTLIEIPFLLEPISGLLFVFKSSRLSDFSKLTDISFLERWQNGEKIWVDDNGSNSWAVYEKTENYASSKYPSVVNKPAQHYGTKIFASNFTSTFIVSAPDYYDAVDNLLGRVFLLDKNVDGSPNLIFSYSLNDENVYFNSTATNSFGFSLESDPIKKLIFAGAPRATNVRTASTLTVVDPNLSFLSFDNQGIVKISLYDENDIDETAKVVVTTPVPADDVLFGYDLAYSTITNSLLVGAPGQNNNAGTVYKYTITSTASTVVTSYQGAITLPTLSSGYRFGSAITGNARLTRYAVSAPGYVNTVNPDSAGSRGAVYVYDTSLVTPQIITGDTLSLPSFFGPTDIFGSTIKMTKDGQYLIIGSPQAYDELHDTQTGVVDIFKWNGTQFTHHQRIYSPIDSTNASFGYDISVDDNGELLVISSIGDGKTAVPTFNKYSERLDPTTALAEYQSVFINDPDSITTKLLTTFDSGSTGFFSTITDAGSVHTYSRFGTKWAHSQEIIDPEIDTGSFYGASVVATNDLIYVGAPAFLDTLNSGNGQIYLFSKIDPSINGWNLLREQEPLVDINKIKRALTINTTDDQIQDYIDVIDPIKGNIIGTAREELKYITSYDPAVYSVGIDGVNVNVSTNWLDSHVGELWWDLSTVKYVWYEQGELEYRKNNWNNVFPGSSIDVYEWVRTEYLPTEWSAIADTTDGLARGVSGQPKFVNNNVVSVKQVYNSVANAFTNVYYYWVKNKNITPSNVSSRRRPALEIAREIANPTATGNKFLAVLSPTSMIIANSKSSIMSDSINLNISFDYINDAANRHTEWLLLQENDPNSRPNWLLEKKLFDSLLGHDSVGNTVPDPQLPSKLKYGVEIRPKQSLFVDRKEALRNIVEFANSVISTELITDRVNFTNLNAKDELPAEETYDLLVEDIFELELVPTSLLETAELSANINSDGKIISVSILNPGFGYITPPTISIAETGSGAELESIINDQGRIIGVNVINGGTNFTESPGLTVRPFTVVVQTDKNLNGKWSLNIWDKDQKQWDRIKTQVYDTTLYWEYIDWASADYNELTSIEYNVESTYEINSLLDIEEGMHVKVLNSGNGRYIILRRTNGTSGSFDNDWDIVYSQNGTIRFLDSLWDVNESFYAWDEFAGFDQTRFDQAPDQEIFYALTALRDDIFINNLKINWNKLFFKAVRYAFSEQTTLDWAFKTTFISAINNLGSLNQVPTYKLQNSQNYEDFLEEIKPYHTKIRRFTEVYTGTEYSQSYTTDFDLPSYFNESTQKFETVNFGNDLLLSYPWKSWYDNFTYGIESIEIYDGGAGYTEVPAVHIVAANGDTGQGAEAVAHISLGKISRIDIINPGAGYTSAPTIILNGGATVTSTAKVYARLGNCPVRINHLTMKFDRVSGVREIGNKYYTDVFVSLGEDVTYDLTWVPIPDKTEITLTLNGVLQLMDSYTIEYSEGKYSPQSNTTYTKKFATLRLLFTPQNGDSIEITYPKNLDFYTAVDRIEDYYAPGPGMPGKESDQLMTGLSYPGLQIDTLPFDATGGWDVVPYGVSTWDNYSLETGYMSFSTTAQTTQTFTLTNMIITTGTQVNVYLNGVRVDSTLSNAVVPTLIGKGTGAVDYIEIQGPGAGYSSTFTSVTISAPNNLSGTQATANAIVVNGEITGVNILNKGSGYTEDPVVTITGPSSIQAYAKAVLKAEFTTSTSTVIRTEVIIPGGTSTFATTSTLVVFRYSTSDGTLQPTDLGNLDSAISGGDLAYTTALGLTPSEIILDGGSTSTQFISGMNDDGFLNPYNSYAPEECVPGQVQEAIGISVYDQPVNSTPIIATRNYIVDGSTSTFKLGVTPSNDDSVIAIFNNTKLTPSEFSIDYKNNTFTFSSANPGTGWLSVTSMQLAGIMLIDHYTDTITTTSSVVTSVAYSDIGSNGSSTYVTVDGIPAVAGVGYTVENYQSRAKLTFLQTGTVQAYLFNAPVKAFSEISEQVITAYDTEYAFALAQSPGVAGPFHSQVIVTLNGLRLNPPITTYYQVTDNQLTFDVSQSITFPSRGVSLADLEVYVNGVREEVPGIWRLTQAKNQINFTTGSLTIGDVVAIVVKKGHDYLIENSQLVLVTPLDDTSEIRITTFTNHDPSFIRTERFTGNPTNQYPMQRAALDSSYVWVTYNGTPLMTDIDYRVSTDGYTVIIRDDIFKSIDDAVVITSFASQEIRMSSYRIFKDLLGRTHYKRLSNENTTYLVQDLYTTSTSIVVEDASVLTPPDVNSKIPGVVLIDGERIEFFTIVGNTLGQLRRGTLGTMPVPVYLSGKPMIDQGALQTMPVRDFAQTTATIISTSTQVAFDLSNSIRFNTSVAFTDQVEVRYGGRKLLKPNLHTVQHDYDLSYDSTSTADTVIVPEFSISTSSVLTLNFAPDAGVKLEVIARNSTVFDQTTINFIRERSASLPDKYRYGQ
jgi:hypothetical protein